MKLKTKLFALLMVVMLAVSLVGCGQSAPAASNPPAAGNEAAPTERTVTDMAGRAVTLPAEVKTVGTIGSIGVLNAFVETLSAGERITNEGSPSFVKSPSWEKYQYKFTPQIKDLKPFQGADSELLMENILAAKPDVCLTMSSDLTEQLEKQGIKGIQLSWTKTEDVKECITLLGEVLNQQEVAADYLKYFDNMLAKAANLTKGIKEADKKTVVYGSVSQFSQPHLIAEWWIDQAGGISVTAEASAKANKESLTYTLEDLLKWNPDMMFVSSAAEKKAVLEDARLGEITAVKNGDIYILPRIAHVWGNRTTEQPLTIMWAINKLYPELVPDSELAKDISYFYSHFFKYDFNDEQLKEIMGQ
ncbi:MAG TPA: ABC transporter substrate-binding protein [Desulfitobacterium dehalogenans]|uniref:ABC transporter substrate-binding protein n=1 Tax=Desulfitobacterium dehalogenans TaxID=36854 RepID=A0A7C7D814_9FIRM|nr:ABC transporter substrate-binding protein [Desulfitobacterium dehalogenans]